MTWPRRTPTAGGHGGPDEKKPSGSFSDHLTHKHTHNAQITEGKERGYDAAAIIVRDDEKLGGKQAPPRWANMILKRRRHYVLSIS
jgi:hypothetical protein